MFRQAYILTFALIAMPPWITAISAQSEGIIVSGVGDAMARPTAVEFDLGVSGNAEIFGDALVKFRDAKRRTLDAFEALAIKNLTVEERGLALARGDTAEMQNRAMRGDTSGNLKSKIEVQSRLRVRITDIHEMPSEQVLEMIGKLIDTARDAGNEVGPTMAEINTSYRYGRQVNGALARFVLENFDEVREEAYDLAMQDARRRAERLARLGGVRLGKVEGINEAGVSGEDSMNQNTNQFGVPIQDDSRRSKPRVASDTLADIPVRVRLQVRFAIADDAQPTAGLGARNAD